LTCSPPARYIGIWEAAGAEVRPLVGKKVGKWASDANVRLKAAVCSIYVINIPDGHLHFAFFHWLFFYFGSAFTSARLACKWEMESENSTCAQLFRVRPERSYLYDFISSACEVDEIKIVSRQSKTKKQHVPEILANVIQW